MKSRLHKFLVILGYKWAMASAYLTQEHSPILSQHWLKKADELWVEWWKLDKQTT